MSERTGWAPERREDRHVVDNDIRELQRDLHFEKGDTSTFDRRDHGHSHQKNRFADEMGGNVDTRGPHHNGRYIGSRGDSWPAWTEEPLWCDQPDGRTHGEHLEKWRQHASRHSRGPRYDR